MIVDLDSHSMLEFEHDSTSQTTSRVKARIEISLSKRMFTVNTPLTPLSNDLYPSTIPHTAQILLLLLLKYSRKETKSNKSNSRQTYATVYSTQQRQMVINLQSILAQSGIHPHLRKWKRQEENAAAIKNNTPAKDVRFSGDNYYRDIW